MFFNLRWVSALLVILGAVGLFLSAWIVVPAPTFALLPLGVGAPEVSPWLIGGNAIVLLTGIFSLRNRPARAALVCSAIGLVISCFPLAQLPAAQQQMATAMQQGLGSDYQKAMAATGLRGIDQRQMRPQPFVWADVFRGIAIPQVRHTALALGDGVPLQMEIYRPLQIGQYPAIVAIYGGAWQHGSPAANADFNRYMAAQGYVVWAIDYRHAPQYQFPAQLEDVQTALRFVQQHAAEYETDIDRVALMGRSSGAHLAMLAAYQSPVLPIRAVVNYYGPVDLAAGYANPPRPDPIDSRAVLTAFLGGSPQARPQQYRSASPITYITHPQPPTLLVYGDRDHVVQAKYGRLLFDRLQAVRSQAVLLEIPWAEHAFDAVFSGLSQQLTLYYTERFLDYVLRF